MTRDDVVLKPCPFCGCRPSISSYPEDEDIVKWAVACDCSNAPEDQPYAERYVNVHGSSQAEAITAWNTRASPSASADRGGLPEPPGPTSEPKAEGEVGWLVESHDGGPVYQMTGRSTRNAAEALRFARQQDAEAFIRAYGPNHLNSISTPVWKAVEHRWG